VDCLERVVLLAFAHREGDDVAWRVSLLEGELTVVCQAWDATKVKLLILVDKAETADQLRGFELCLTIVGPPP
jgi:hypothetical protein